ncbi:MAG: ABC transporter permease subunit [Chloroflexi bacterium]|nr:ABC transporter permease subunit [Ardenticatenaceae bacterium]MBL1129998.1 ABC transporter permease [Chloroflexota bacterium]NOG36084.1 ABC transporter permease subunit [Chloroflexota bacterium]GIK59002.1 MAG: ABC transporter permease [Chloroflexota bacterium]
MLRLLWQELQFRRNGIIGWGIGISFYAVLYVGLYPSFGDQLALFDMGEMAFYEALGITDMTSFAGYVASTYVNLAPILLSIYAILSGSGTLAGEEDEGKLELMVTLPIPRWQIVTAKALATAVALFLILTIVGLAAAGIFSAIASQVETPVTAVDMFLSALYMWPLVMVVAMISLLMGAYLPNRRTAALAATVIFVGNYFGNSLANMYNALDAIKPLLIFTYYDNAPAVLTEGQAIADIAVLVGISLVLILLAVWAFQRRNITVGAWPWQRAKVV